MRRDWAKPNRYRKKCNDSPHPLTTAMGGCIFPSYPDTETAMKRTKKMTREQLKEVARKELEAFKASRKKDCVDGKVYASGSTAVHRLTAL